MEAATTIGFTQILLFFLLQCNSYFQSIATILVQCYIYLMHVALFFTFTILD